MTQTTPSRKLIVYNLDGSSFVLVDANGLQAAGATSNIEIDHTPGITWLSGSKALSEYLGLSWEPGDELERPHRTGPSRMKVTIELDVHAMRWVTET